MRYIRPVIALAAAAFLSAVGTVAATPAYAAAENYVALGDSYASGTGAGSYSGGDCYRSANAYAQRWADENAPASFTFAACSGATTEDVRSSQLSALSADTTLVSISIGGNDAGFADVMITCTTSSDSSCVSRVDEAKEFARSELPGRLDALYGEIRAAAPNARVVVMGYPRVLTSDSCWWFSSAKREAVNSAADELSGIIADRAAAAGFTYVDVRDAFAGHEACASDDWINGIVWSNLVESYHPNAAGHANAYYPAFASAVTQAAVA
ncbi:SGNH/GDSL hydrolase family protein [Thermocrispum municipale]|jgi:lysophospholipase L1-like esterase|uniref:SGNH/GDSL hydrolase family protein n=1 Tax=Thermocrispum municipale TaxID=37926 RepID=UPI000417CA72|nr:SGNH/GDSL hydrolase family protein [Thermocrispum municipale]